MVAMALQFKYLVTTCFLISYKLNTYFPAVTLEHPNICDIYIYAIRVPKYMQMIAVKEH